MHISGNKHISGNWNVGMRPLIFLGLMLAVTAASASERTRQLSPQQGRPMIGGPFGSAVPRNHEVVKRAFREVVREVNPSVVRILSDDQSVALGVIATSDGYILTKNSQLGRQIECHLYNDRRLPASVVQVHAEYDLAVLKIDATGLTPARWGNGDPPLGSWVITPGLSSVPLSVGVMSAKPRKIPPAQGILGIHLSQADGRATVDEVMRGSGAEEAGLQMNDVIVRVNDQPVSTRSRLQEAIRQYKPGDRVQLTIVRDDTEQSLEAVLRTHTQIRDLGDRRGISLHGPVSNRATDFPKALQHDSVLNPKDCGGPLINLDGEVVGLNIARVSRISSYAIPASELLPIVRSIRSGELVSTTQ